MDILAVLSIPFDPDIIRTAGFILSWHGFFTFVAVAVAVYLTWRWGRREGLDGDAILSVSTWCIIGGIIGARILHVVDFWDDVYQYDPMRILYFWNGGIAIFGAYLGGFAGGAVYTSPCATPPRCIVPATTLPCGGRECTGLFRRCRRWPISPT